MIRRALLSVIAIAVTTPSGVEVQAKSDSTGKIGRTMVESKEYRSTVDQEGGQDWQGTVVEHGESEHQFHRNHFGGFLGASTHFDSDETGFTLGLEYARQFSPRWAVAGYTELASDDLERDIILAAGVIFYPMPGLGLVVAPGIEFAGKDVEHGGEVSKEDETEFLLRFGAAYGFPVGQGFLGPAVFADRAGDRWTLVYGVGLVTGF